MERPVETSVLPTPVLAPHMVKVGLARERGGGVETVAKNAGKEGKRKAKRRASHRRRRRRKRGSIFTLSLRGRRV